MGQIEPKSHMHKIKYATLAKRSKFYYHKEKKNMKNPMSFEYWMKILSFLLLAVVCIYITIIIFEYYWPKYDKLYNDKTEESDLPIIIHLDKNTKKTEIIDFDKASDEELKEAGLIDIDDTEKEFIYSIDNPQKTII